MGKKKKAIRLDEEVRGLSVEEEIALGEYDLRKTTAKKILWVFIGANVVVFIGLGVIFGYDVTLLHQKLVMPSDRLLTTEVIMTVVGATTVQLGAIMFTMARYLFPTDSR